MDDRHAEDNVSTADAAGWIGRIIERWGFPILVAVASGWVLRYDVLLPLVDAHVKFLDQLTETQREIVETTREQTRLLYAMQPELRQRIVSGEEER